MGKKGPDFVALDGLSIGNQHAIDAMMAVIAYFAINGEISRSTKDQISYNPRNRQVEIAQGNGFRVLANNRPIQNPRKNFRRQG